MSDFDKEAEREKLREKYEREEEKREATEQMSELLLKGATMTNAHCSDCGDPIFRYDGQEFCPTCEKPVDRGGEEGADEEGAGDDATGQGNVEVASPSDDARVKFGGDQEEDAGENAAAGTVDAAADRSSQQPRGAPARADSPNADDPDVGRPNEDRPTADHPDADRTGPREPTRSAPSLDPSSSTRTADDRAAEQQSGGGDVASHVANARASLARTAERFARAAEATDDPSVAREHLETAREAAAALDELD